MIFFYLWPNILFTYCNDEKSCTFSLLLERRSYIGTLSRVFRYKRPHFYSGIECEYFATWVKMKKKWNTLKIFGSQLQDTAEMPLEVDDRRSWLRASCTSNTKNQAKWPQWRPTSPGETLTQRTHWAVAPQSKSWVLDIPPVGAVKTLAPLKSFLDPTQSLHRAAKTSIIWAKPRGAWRRC